MTDNSSNVAYVAFFNTTQQIIKNSQGPMLTDYQNKIDGNLEHRCPQQISSKAKKKRLNMKKKHLSFFHKTQKLHFFSLIEAQKWARERPESGRQ